MGVAQSKETPPQTSEEKLLERLRMIRMQDSGSTGDYIAIERGDPPAYTSRSTSVSISTAERWERELLEDPKNRLALAALSANAAHDVLRSRAATIADAQNFNVRIPFEGSPVTDQRSSGRCWLFASTNVFRVAIMQRYKLKEFELSQAYLFFWDKLEKANYFLENILDTVDEPLDGRLVQELLSGPVSDGGQWDMAANLVEKYGLVPQSLYPDSFNAMNSAAMNRLITTKLREDALRLRTMSRSKDPAVRSTIASAKSDMLREIHLILTVMLGPPPSPTAPFAWEYHDRDGAFHRVQSTPTAFAAQLSDPRAVRACQGTDVRRLFSLVHDPRHPFRRLLTVDRLGNVRGGRPITYVNVDMPVIKAACVRMLRRGIPVFFGCDVGKYSDSQRGIMDPALYDYELGFNVKLGMSKAERLLAGESAMTHAMVLTGVHVVDGETVRWRVENSWSESRGSKGYFVMSDAWMDEFVYQAVVDPAFVSEDVRKVLDQTPMVLNLWDPMGALA